MTTKPKINHHPGAGDVELVLGETTIVLKPTLQAGLSISRQAGGIRGAIDKVVAMDLDTIVSVIRVGVGPVEAKRLKRLEELVYENGLTDAQGEVLGKCLEFLSNLARGGRPAEAVEEAASEDPPATQS